MKKIIIKIKNVKGRTAKMIFTEYGNKTLVNIHSNGYKSRRYLYNHDIDYNVGIMTACFKTLNIAYKILEHKGVTV